MYSVFGKSWKFVCATKLYFVNPGNLPVRATKLYFVCCNLWKPARETELLGQERPRTKPLTKGVQGSEKDRRISWDRSRGEDKCTRSYVPVRALVLTAVYAAMYFVFCTERQSARKDREERSAPSNLDSVTAPLSAYGP